MYAFFLLLDKFLTNNRPCHYLIQTASLTSRIVIDWVVPNRDMAKSIQKLPYQFHNSHGIHMELRQIFVLNMLILWIRAALPAVHRLHVACKVMRISIISMASNLKHCYRSSNCGPRCQSAKNAVHNEQKVGQAYYKCTILKFTYR